MIEANSSKCNVIDLSSSLKTQTQILKNIEKLLKEQKSSNSSNAMATKGASSMKSSKFKTVNDNIAESVSDIINTAIKLGDRNTIKLLRNAKRHGLNAFEKFMTGENGVIDVYKRVAERIEDLNIGDPKDADKNRRKTNTIIGTIGSLMSVMDTAMKLGDIETRHRLRMARIFGLKPFEKYLNKLIDVVSNSAKTIKGEKRVTI